MSQSPIIETIHTLAEATLGQTVAIEQLSELLLTLTEELEANSFAALAFVAEAAAKNCLYCPGDDETKRTALFDLCERLLNAVISTEPFNFGGIHPDLQWMLVTPPDQVAATFNTEAAEVPEAAAKPAEVSGSEHADSNELMNCQCSDPELLDEFLTEADEHLDQAEQLILALETDPQDKEAINGVFRAVHSLKGSSGILGLTPLAKLSHVAESMLVRLRDGALALTPDVLAAVLASMDYLRRQIVSIRQTRQPSGALECLIAPLVLIEILETLTQKGTCDRNLFDHLRQEESGESVADVVVKTTSTAPKQESLRVDCKRLQQLIDLIGELVITESAVAQELAKQDSLTASSVSTRLRKVVRDVQQLSLGLKMVPVGAILQKMNRMVRDVSAQLGKPCRFVIEGADTEVDKTLLEGLADPLVHLIRNSLDHGIEPSVSDRIAAGKPETATIRVSAEHRAGSIVITISDDGRGLNRERIYSRAIEKGIIAANLKLTNADIDQLIFKPGFSTAATVSDISGRGVGMDVVRKNVENLRGTIAVHSNPGKGMDIVLELPLTLSIIDGTVTKVGDRSYIIPTLAVIEQIQASNMELITQGQRKLVRFRDSYIPLTRLSELLNIEPGHPPKHGEVCLVVQACQKQWAFLVDRVLGQQSIVIKPLGGVLDAFEHFAGGALLAGGEIGFVIELNTLFTNAMR